MVNARGSPARIMLTKSCSYLPSLGRIAARLFSCMVVFLLVCGGGCRKQTRSVAVPPLPPPDHFQTAEAHFQAGDYGRAAEFYPLYLEGDPGAADRVKALFHLGLVYALPASPLQDLERAKTLFRQIGMLFPESPEAAQADFIVELLTRQELLQSDLSRSKSRIEQLSEALERIKEIDMQRQP